MKKRIWTSALIVLLALMMGLSAFAVEDAGTTEKLPTEEPSETTENAEEEETFDPVNYWKVWSQTDDRWGDMSISSEGHSKYNMRGEGCLITAIAKIFVLAGQQEPESFTPADCLDAMLEYGLLSSSGAIYSGFRMNDNGFLATYAPDLYYEPDYVHSAWSQSRAYSKISEMIEGGSYVIIRSYNHLTGNGHYMAVERAEDGIIYVMDNKEVIDLYGCGKYGGVSQVLCFRYSGDYTYPARDAIVAERAAVEEAERLEQEKMDEIKETSELLYNFVRIYNYFDGMFKDVTADAWYSAGIQAAYELGLVKGTGEDEFGVGTEFTVGAAITIAARMHSTYYGINEDFVQGDVWYQVYVDYAIAHGIMIPGRFASFERSATRAEVVEILSAAVPQGALGVINNITPDYIPDVSADAPYAESVYGFYRAGVLTGGDGNAFSPESLINREEAATIVARMVVTSMRRTFSME